MNLRTSNHVYGVDAGNIGVIDYAIVNRRPDFCNVFDVKEAGWYKVTLTIRNTWLADLTKRTVKVYTKSGKFIVGDICYSGLGAELFKKESDQHFWIDTGGDGQFYARVIFKQEPEVF